MTDLTREGLVELAERVEKALPWEVDNSPHFHNMRKLDLAIARAVNWTSAIGSGRGDRYGVPAYTASIDAAMTLVPEGLWAEGSLSSPGQLEVHGPCTYDPLGKGWAATPALALCAAALKARARAMEAGRG